VHHIKRLERVVHYSPKSSTQLFLLTSKRGGLKLVAVADSSSSTWYFCLHQRRGELVTVAEQIRPTSVLCLIPNANELVPGTVTASQRACCVLTSSEVSWPYVQFRTSTPCYGSRHNTLRGLKHSSNSSISVLCSHQASKLVFVAEQIRQHGILAHIKRGELVVVAVQLSHSMLWLYIKRGELVCCCRTAPSTRYCCSHKAR